MIEDFRENLLTNVMTKIGFNDLFDKDTPVMIKQDFVINEYSLLKAGTIGYIKKIKPYNIKYKKGFAVCDLTLSTPKHRDITLLCKVSDETDNVKVVGIKGDIEFKELIEITDEEIGKAIERYSTLREDYENMSWRYDNMNDKTSCICFACAIITFFIGIITGIALKNMTLSITLIVSAAIIATVGIILYHRTFNKTVKGKTLNSEIESLAEKISKEDEKLCKKFMN